MNTSIFPNTGQWKHELARQGRTNETRPVESERRVPKRSEEVVLPETIKWARSIPSALRPRALVIKFPRIANAMAGAWKQPKLFNILLCQLMLDDRGGRQGFPFDVLRDLANLRVHFDSEYRHPGTDIWTSVTDRYNKLN